MCSMNKVFFCIVLLYCVDVYTAVHLVTNIHDRGPGSLRQSILDANSDVTVPRAIHFSIDSGVQTVQPLAKLPALTASNIIIDGTTQPGWTQGHPVIVLDGAIAAFRFDGIIIDGADNCTIQGIVINNGFLHGISIINNAHDNVIYECFIGTDQSGTHVSANAIGLMASAFGLHQNNNTIIGAPGRGNVISGNTYIGIFLSGNVNNTLIQTNKIGTDITGTIALANIKAGIAIGTIPINSQATSSNIHIGGLGAQERNLISGNGAGIITGFQSIFDMVIEGNIFGFDITGISPLPNIKNIVTIQSVIPASDNFIVQNNIMQAGRHE